jgi:hypothetical protein
VRERADEDRRRAVVRRSHLQNQPIEIGNLILLVVHDLLCRETPFTQALLSMFVVAADLSKVHGSRGKSLLQPPFYHGPSQKATALCDLRWLW